MEKGERKAYTYTKHMAYKGTHLAESELGISLWTRREREGESEREHTKQIPQ